MAFQAKTDWKYNETPTEQDMNRVEQGIQTLDTETAALVASKSQPNGIASLDADGKHPMTEVPDIYTKQINVQAPLTVSRTTVAKADCLADFTGKVQGSLTENPHVAKYRYATASDAPSAFTAENGPTFYTNIAVQDGGTAGSPGTSVSTQYAQQLFSFNLLEQVRRQYDVPRNFSVSDLLAKIRSITVTWVGYGKGANSGVEAYGSSIFAWRLSMSSSWNSLRSGTASSPETLTATIAVSNAEGYRPADYIDGNGFFNVFARPSYVSNGTIASAVYTDYVRVDFTLQDVPLRSETSVTTDYAGKVTGDAVTVPHVYKGRNASAFSDPSGFTTEQVQASYDSLCAVDGATAVISNPTNTGYAQALFAFDLLTIAHRQYNIPDNLTVEQFREILKSITVTWVGYGKGANASVETFGATVKAWRSEAGSYATLKTGTASTPESLVHTCITTNAEGYRPADYIDDNGFYNALAHPTYPSDGVIASTIYTDYIKVDMTLEADMLVADGRSLSRIGTGACITASAVQSIGSGSETPVVFDRLAYDSQGAADVAGSRLVIGEDGIYTASGSITFASNATGRRSLYIYKNLDRIATDIRNAVSGDATHVTLTTPPFAAKAGDYLYVNCDQNSGVSLNASDAQFAVLKVG